MECKDYELDVHLKSEIVTWEEYQKKIQMLAQLIDKSIYDYVIGIFQGGYIVAMSLADYLLKARTGGIISDMGSVVFTENVKGDDCEIRGKNILLVDEVVESGRSIQKCKNILLKYNVGIIRTACIYYNVYSNEKIDYYVERFSLNKNFIFPWRINRDCISLLTDVMQKNKEYDEYTLKNEIEKVYGVTLNPQIIINCLENKETIFNKKNGAWYILSD